MLLQSRKPRVLVLSFFRLFHFFRLCSHSVGNKLLLFNLLDLCPVGRCLCLVIGLPARERGRLRRSLFHPWRSSGARTDRSVSYSYPQTTQRIIIKQQKGVKPTENNGINEEMSMQYTQKHSYLIFKVPKQRWFFAKLTSNYWGHYVDLVLHSKIILTLYLLSAKAPSQCALTVALKNGLSQGSQSSLVSIFAFSV